MTNRSLIASVVWLVPASTVAFAPAPPRLELDGKTNGSATLSTAFGFTIPIRHFDLTPWATYEVGSKDGIATLFSVTDTADATKTAAPPPWSLGGTLTIRWWGGKLKEIDEKERATAEASAYGACAAQCRGLAPIDDGETFCKTRKTALEQAARDWLAPRVADRKPGEYCDEQRKDIEALEELVKNGAVSHEIASKKRMDALAACLAPCAPDSVVSMEKRAFCWKKYDDFPWDVAPKIIGNDRFCKAGRQIILDLEKRHPYVVSHYQPFLLNVGTQRGEAKYTHLATDPTDVSLLVERKTIVHPWSVGASGAWLFSPGGPTCTLEGIAGWGFRWEGASDKARYCVPAGNVTPPGGAAVPATVCKDVDATAPTGSHSTRGGLYLGWFDQVENRWRFSVGSEATRSADGAWRWTIAAPVHVLVAGSSTYKGLIRIVPSVAFGGDPKAGTVWAVSLALLGQRGFFSEKFDRL